MKRPSKSLRRLLYSLSCLILILGCSPKPPIEEGDFLDSDLVELVKLDSSILLDIRYATDQNFINKAVYEQPRVFLQRPAAEALVRAHNKLKAQGLGLLVFDGYRPWHVTKLFWDLTPDELREFVASPERGSRHNRGCAVDVTMYHLATGKAVEMTSDFDELNETGFLELYSRHSRTKKDEIYLSQSWRSRVLKSFPANGGISITKVGKTIA